MNAFTCTLIILSCCYSLVSPIIDEFAVGQWIKFQDYETLNNFKMRDHNKWRRRTVFFESHSDNRQNPVAKARFDAEFDGKETAHPKIDESWRGIVRCNGFQKFWWLYVEGCGVTPFVPWAWNKENVIVEIVGKRDMFGEGPLYFCVNKQNLEITTANRVKELTSGFPLSSYHLPVFITFFIN